MRYAVIMIYLFYYLQICNGCGPVMDKRYANMYLYVSSKEIGGARELEGKGKCVFLLHIKWFHGVVDISLYEGYN